MDDATTELQRQLQEIRAELAKAHHDRLVAEERVRKTNFEEYIIECHLRLSKPLRIQTDRSLTTKGSVTDPKGRICPTLIKPWVEFPSLQQDCFMILSDSLSRLPNQFSSKQHLQELGEALCDRPFASEKDLEAYQRSAVERPISTIISALLQDKNACRVLKLEGDIVFENHANALADGSGEVEDSLRALGINDVPKPESTPKYSDQICVYKKADGRQSVCMIIEYKPAHKLTTTNLRSGLHRADTGSMHLPRDVFSRPTIPNDADEKFVYLSERLVSAVLTQVYGYMVENGLEYSYITTGEAFVFLQIREDDPHTLYYHLTEPNIDAHTNMEDPALILSSTAISQALCICTFALSSTPRSQQWRNRTIESASQAVVDCHFILQQTPVDIKKSAPPTSEFLSRLSKFRRSPINLRSRNKSQRKVGQSCNPENLSGETPSASSDDASDVETPIKKGQGGARSAPKAESAVVAHLPTAEGTRSSYQAAYCTQKCLDGLMRGIPLDEKCPNVSLHRIRRVDTHHSLNNISFHSAISTQLAKSMDYGCEPLWKQGARGALFKLTLLSHGYVFVAKGTVLAFARDLEHEARVYTHLKGLQGKSIPVYLGSVCLERPYYLDFRVRILCMLMMSWAGEQAIQGQAAQRSLKGIEVDARSMIAVDKLREKGIEHNDVRPANILWSEENGRVMLIDFERSIFLRPSSIPEDDAFVHQHEQTYTCGNYRHISAPSWTTHGRSHDFDMIRKRPILAGLEAHVR